jgi:excinuclease ABC subunit B
MKVAIEETERRRAIQEAYNEEHGITPMTIVKAIDATLVTAYEADYFKVPLEIEKFEEYSPKQLKETITQLEADMRKAAKDMKFEQAAEIRDRLKYLRERQLEYV